MLRPAGDKRHVGFAAREIVDSLAPRRQRLLGGRIFDIFSPAPDAILESRTAVPRRTLRPCSQTGEGLESSSTGWCMCMIVTQSGYPIPCFGILSLISMSCSGEPVRKRCGSRSGGSRIGQVARSDSGCQRIGLCMCSKRCRGFGRVIDMCYLTEAA
jgi:hypothetical protein